MDRVPGLLSRLPQPVWATLALAVSVALFPFEFEATAIFGFPLDTRLTLWFARLAEASTALAVTVGGLYTVRTALAYLERGQWPKKAGPIEMEEANEFIKQIDRGADELSEGSDKARFFERQLKKANDTIRYLEAELARARGEEPRAISERGTGARENGL
jgi:hypothetical protein